MVTEIEMEPDAVRRVKTVESSSHTEADKGTTLWVRGFLERMAAESSALAQFSATSTRQQFSDAATSCASQLSGKPHSPRLAAQLRSAPSCSSSFASCPSLTLISLCYEAGRGAQVVDGYETKIGQLKMR